MDTQRTTIPLLSAALAFALCVDRISAQAPPVVKTTAASSITHNAAMSGGNITQGTLATAITERGLFYAKGKSLTTVPSTATKVVATTAGAGTYTSKLTSLLANTDYTYWAYAIYKTSSKTGLLQLGNARTLTTATVPTVTTAAVTDLRGTTATCGGNVTSDGRMTVTARGVAWSTAQNPTRTLATRTSDGTGTGVFASSITGLQPLTTYFVRAYAVNAAGTSYGAQQTFTTTAAIVQPPTNPAPVVNAGQDQTITLPTNSVNLAATATDANGTITARAWTLVTGPNGSSFTAANNTNTTVNGLVEGTYTFRFTATDNQLATASDDVRITVRSQPLPDLFIVGFVNVFASQSSFESSEMGNYGLCPQATTPNPKITDIPDLILRVGNAGAAATTGNCVVRFTVGTNTNLTSADLTLGALGAGETRDFTIPRTENTVCGAQNAQAVCSRCTNGNLPLWNDRGITATVDFVQNDADGAIIESDETNNSRSFP